MVFCSKVGNQNQQISSLRPTGQKQIRKCSKLGGGGGGKYTVSWAVRKCTVEVKLLIHEQS